MSRIVFNPFLLARIGRYSADVFFGILIHMHLADKKCVPCEGGTPPLESKVIAQLTTELGGSWQVVDGKKIQKQFEFRDFISAMAFVDKVADVAESEGHHPDIHIFYSKVLIELSTHAIGGLSENDFIVAARIDRMR